MTKPLLVARNVGKYKRWPLHLYRCECGNEFMCTAGRINSGNTSSCGCLRKKISPEERKARSHAYYVKNKNRHRENGRKWAEKNKEKNRGMKLSYYYRNKESCLRRGRAWHLKSKYNITPEMYDAALEMQNHACSICGAKEPGGVNNKFHVDHNHRTGEVRGLLCNNCNLGLGYLRDDPEILIRAAGYLKATSGGVDEAG